MIFLSVLFLFILFSVIWTGIRLAWGLTKILCGIGLFVISPFLFFAVLLLGMTGIGFMPALLLVILGASLFGWRRF